MKLVLSLVAVACFLLAASQVTPQVRGQTPSEPEIQQVNRK
jgi:hypothetical protein